METLHLAIQNIPDNIHRLAAQKQLYYEGKKIFLRQFVFTVPVTVLLSLAKVLLITILKIDIAWLPASYGILIAIIDLTIMVPGISKHRSDAAKIQESFDTSVFGLPWNDILVTHRPTIETVNRYFRKLEQRDKTGEMIEKLYNWYPSEVENLPLLKGILICQKSSVNYDFSLRERFKQMIFIRAFIAFLLLLAFAFIENMNIQSAITQVILPFLPVLVLTLKLNQEHTKSNTNLVDLKAHLDRCLAEPEGSLTMDKIRRLQDRIYLNRKESPLIPERFYYRLREKLEHEMHDNATTLT